MQRQNAVSPALPHDGSHKQVYSRTQTYLKQQTNSY
jgi:hypothetical protein